MMTPITLTTHLPLDQEAPREEQGTAPHQTLVATAPDLLLMGLRLADETTLHTSQTHMTVTRVCPYPPSHEMGTLPLTATDLVVGVRTGQVGRQALVVLSGWDPPADSHQLEEEAPARAMEAHSQSQTTAHLIPITVVEAPRAMAVTLLAVHPLETPLLLIDMVAPLEAVMEGPATRAALWEVAVEEAVVMV